MPTKYLMLVCTSDQAKQTGTCCKERGSESLIDLFRQEAEQFGIAGQLEVRPSGCLHNCRLGSSVKVFPGGVLYSKVSEEDVREIIESHLIHKKPVDRLITGKTNRFLGF